ncbi:hypothetical protein [Sorangium sp. So ce861]|uniref:hypothetical protein n=1 Tax=Sorangium sp. So ce861 TaxID=3133323 RepID=UPI003F5E5B3C
MSPIFRGARFENHEVPLDVLPDLAAYRDLVADVARHLFLVRSPKRKRVPKGFANSFELVLRRIDEGSAIPVLERVPPASRAGVRPPFGATADPFVEARDLIDEVIAAAASKRPIPHDFPEALLPRFNQIGRGLRGNESVEFRAPNRPSGPRFDREVRKWLVLRTEAGYEDNVEITGELRGGHIDREVLNLRLDEGREIEVRCASRAVSEYLPSRSKRVRVIGWGLYDRHDRLERVIRVDDLALLDDEEDTWSPASIDQQFARLQVLEPGWYEPESPAPTPEGLERVRLFLHAVLDGADLPRPHVYPTPDAGVSAEWSLPDWEVGAAFDPLGERVELHATHLRSQAGSEEEIQLSSANAAETFARFVASFCPPAS